MEIRPVPSHEKPLLWDMLQTYIAELAPSAGVERVNGVYEYRFFENYWTDEDRWPFWAVEDGERVGFALILQDHEHHAMRVGEFFILPEFRRDGLGVSFARQILERFPGSWKIRQMAVNAPAVAFWRKVVAPYGHTEEKFHDRDLDRVEQTLVVPQG